MILVRFFMTGGNTEIGAVCFGGSVEGDFRFPVSGFRRRQSGHDHPESSHIDRSPVAINRNSVAINRNSVTINRNPVTINRNSVTINRNPVTINRNSITINRNPVTINRNLVSINRNVVSINRNPVSINRNPVSINRNPVTINRSLVSINWNLVSINRNSVSIDWNPVTFDRGQTFVLHGQRRSDPGCTPEACGRLAGRKRRRRAATGFGCNRDGTPAGCRCGGCHATPAGVEVEGEFHPVAACLRHLPPANFRHASGVQTKGIGQQSFDRGQTFVLHEQRRSDPAARRRRAGD
ncbi:MAG TPA: hypothetical protein VGF69_05810 [Thermoanaerobaculia bacterium]